MTCCDILYVTKIVIIYTLKLNSCNYCIKQNVMNNINDNKYHLYLNCGGFSAGGSPVSERCKHVYLDSRFIYYVQPIVLCHL